MIIHFRKYIKRIVCSNRASPSRNVLSLARTEKHDILCVRVVRCPDPNKDKKKILLDSFAINPVHSGRQV